MVLWMHQALYTEAPPSRFLALFKDLRRFFPESYVIMQGNGNPPRDDGHILGITPRIPIRGRFRLAKGLIFRLQMAFATTSLILGKRIDCVVMRGEDTILILPILKVLNIFVIYDFHGLKSRELLYRKHLLRAWIVKGIEAILLRFSDRILVVSSGVVLQVPRYEHKCMYLPNGVDISEIEGSTRDCNISFPAHEHIIGFVGNWEQCMKIEDICEAARYVKDTIAVIIGRGYHADSYRLKYRDRKEVIFTGRIERECAYSLLKKFDMGIIPYDKNSYMAQIENFLMSRKIFEYLAAGKPIIQSDVIGRPDFLEENIHYLSYKSGDPLDLAEKVQFLIKHPDLSRQMGESNSRLAREFSWERLIEKSGLIDTIRSINR